MTPAAIPVLLIYGGVVRSSADAPAAPRRVWLLAAGYFTTWAAFSVGATVLQRLLSAVAIVTPMMEVTTASPPAPCWRWPVPIS